MAVPHARTIDCIRKAEALVADATYDSLRYASLQLRMGIEYLFYELIPLYKEELPDDIYAQWQPRQVIDALLNCDPLVDQDATIAIGQNPLETDAPDVLLVKQSKAVNKRMIREHYHRLGAFLHAPTDLKEPSRDKLIDALNKCLSCLRQYTANQVLCNIRCLVEIDCDCGRTIKRNRRAIEARPEVQCPDPACGAIYDAAFEDNDTMQFKLRHTAFACPYCKKANCIPFHLIKDGASISCCECDRRMHVRSSYVLVPTE